MREERTRGVVKTRGGQERNASAPRPPRADAALPAPPPSDDQQELTSRMPGAMLRAELDCRRMTQRALVDALGGKYDAPFVSRVVSGDYRIGLAFACALEDAGIGTARGWLMAQVDYDLRRTRDLFRARSR